MAVNIYQSLTNPVSGETFECISSSEEAYVMHWQLGPSGYVPFAHVHTEQDEIFEVKRGELKVMMNGRPHIAKAGETLIVLKGTPHLASNNLNEALETVVSYKPGLDQQQFFKCFYGLIQDGYIDKKGGVLIPMMGYCIDRMKLRANTYPTTIPRPLLKLSFKIFRTIGALRGWGKLYDKYMSS